MKRILLVLALCSPLIVYGNDELLSSHSVGEQGALGLVRITWNGKVKVHVPAGQYWDAEGNIIKIKDEDE